MGGSGTVALAGVATPDIGGVTITRSALHYEAQRSLGIARRVGRRLVRWLRTTDGQTEEISRVVGRDPETGRELREPILTADGASMFGPILPDEDFRKSWDLYERTVRSLLVEQRARALLAAADQTPQVPDDQFEAQIAQLARKAVMEMPRAELEALLTARRMSIVQGATESRESPSPGEPASHRTESAEPDSPTAPQARMSPGGDDSGEPPDLLDFESGND